jgi:DNA repair protein RadC
LGNQYIISNGKKNLVAQDWYERSSIGESVGSNPTKVPDHNPSNRATTTKSRSVMTKGYSTVPIYSLKLIREKTLRYPVSRVPDAMVGAECLRHYLRDKECEHLVVLMLDGNSNLIGVHLAGIGGITGTWSSPRDCLKSAIVARAHTIILGHNHPSGDPTPSPEDIAFTERVREAGKVIGIPVVDHIIVSSGLTEQSFSFYGEGLL